MAAINPLNNALKNAQSAIDALSDISVHIAVDSDACPDPVLADKLWRFSVWLDALTSHMAGVVGDNADVLKTFDEHHSQWHGVPNAVASTKRAESRQGVA